jgi:hypothetical protein
MKNNSFESGRLLTTLNNGGAELVHPDNAG